MDEMNAAEKAIDLRPRALRRLLMDMRKATPEEWKAETKLGRACDVIEALVAEVVDLRQELLPEAKRICGAVVERYQWQRREDELRKLEIKTEMLERMYGWMDKLCAGYRNVGGGK